MRFTYYYKTSDGTRCEATIEAPSRDAAFAALRAHGVRPIKMFAAGGARIGTVRRRVVLAVAVCVALVAGGAFWTLGRWSVGASAYLRMDGTEARGVNQHVATPMTRRQINGDGAQVAEMVHTGARFLFEHPAEAYLAAYAQPGWTVEAVALSDALARDLLASIERPIYTFPDERRECVELKSIVAGMKEELRMFLASGGTVAEYVSRIESRQRTEITTRAEAEARIQRVLTEKPAEEVLTIWTSLNRDLNAMGIRRLSLPPQLFHLVEDELE